MRVFIQLEWTGDWGLDHEPQQGPERGRLFATSRPPSSLSLVTHGCRRPEWKHKYQLEAGCTWQYLCRQRWGGSFGPIGARLPMARSPIICATTAMRSRCRRPGGISMPVGRSCCRMGWMRRRCRGGWGLGRSAGGRSVGLAVCGWWRWGRRRCDAQDQRRAKAGAFSTTNYHVCCILMLDIVVLRKASKLYKLPVLPHALANR